MKTLSNTYKKAFLVLLITTSVLGGLTAGNLANSDYSTLNCLSCTNESSMTEGANEIESWMNSDLYWGSYRVTEVIEDESNNMIENWMVNNDYWGTLNVSETIENDNTNKVESWMASNQFWGSIDLTEVLEPENANLVEQWMSSNTFWIEGMVISNEELDGEAQLTVESWMADASQWE